ncbi:MAG: hypothetical protein WC761_04335 [Candidatus Paceibacterota bacterium]|jgi:F-type H+-transporting ATPase subunit epsilon
MQLRIYSLEGTVFEGETNEVSLPSTDGEITILKNHIPLITTLKAGNLKFEGQTIPVKGGFAEIGADKVVVLVS